MVGSTYAMDDVTGEKSSISCSICLDVVAGNGQRSIARLQCGHEFHLDCIGSAFNMKGAMQCPNCRMIEGGRWLFANGSSRSLSDFSLDDWTFHEEPYEFGYSEMPFGVHWCPFSGLTGIHSSFEEVEPPSITYHDFLGNHAAIFSEHIAASSLAHSHVAAFIRPVPRTSNESQSGQNEVYNPHSFPAPNAHQYQSWARHLPPLSANRSHNINGGDQASGPPATLRSAQVESDAMPRFGPVVHPFLYGHGPVTRGGSSIRSSIVHPGNNTRSHERVPVPHGIHHPQQPSNPMGMLSSSMIPGARRFNGPRGLPLIMPAAPPSDRHGGGFFIFPPLGTPSPHEIEPRFPVSSFERDAGRESSQHPSGGSDPNTRFGSFWQRHWS